MSIRIIASFILAVICGSSVAWSALAAPQTMYRVTDLGTLGGSLVSGYRVNDSGQVVGEAQNASSQWRPFLWEAGSMTDLGSLGGDFGFAHGINESGQVVGGSRLASKPYRAFLWDNGTMTDLGTLETAHSSSFAYGINALGQIVGQSASRVFLWDNGTMTDIGDLGGGTSSYPDINGVGQITGYSNLSTGAWRAFLWDNGQMTDLGTLGGATSYAYGINDVGQVVGEAQTSGGAWRAFLWDDGMMHALGVLEESANYYAGDINAAGQVVGSSWGSGMPELAIIWSDGFVADLNTLIDPTDPLAPYVQLLWAWGINSSGQIVVNGRDTRITEWHSRAYLLTPVTADQQAPVVSDLAASPNPVAVGMETQVSALATGESLIVSAGWTLNGDSGAMDPADGQFDETSEALAAQISAPSAAGLYELCVNATDSGGLQGEAECVDLVVYDPSAGFVTGGGWIWSPQGALLADIDVEGRANFGFVSRYNRNRNLPDGNAQFVFRAGDLNFQSTAYDWLIVNQAGRNAQFKGAGRVNGESGYQFMIWAGAGTGPNGGDTFRIKIWADDGSGDVYDNSFNQEIGGGRIMIQH